MFELKFKTGNDAFNEYPEMEIKRILEEVATEVENMRDHGSIRDINGNKVGEWIWK